MGNVVRRFSLLFCASIFAMVGARVGEAADGEVAAVEPEPPFSTFDGIRLGVSFCYQKMLKDAAIAGGAVGIVAAVASFFPFLPGPFRKFKAAAWLGAASSLLSLAYNCWNERFLMVRGNDDIRGKKNVIISKDVETLQDMIGSSPNVPNDTLRIVTFQEGSRLQRVSKKAFRYCRALTQVVLPRSVTEIGMGAFSSCFALQEINIPTNVTKIGAKAFEECLAMKEIDLPIGLGSIGQGAFRNCLALKAIDIPENVVNIEDETFERCKSLASVTFANGVQTIGASAFYECVALEAIVFPCSVIQIGMKAFESCRALGTIVVQKNNTDTDIGAKIQEKAFCDCAELKTVILDRVRDIGVRAFWGCKALGRLTIPSSVTNIGAYAFEGGEALKIVKFEEGLQTIGECSFSSCVALGEVILPDSIEVIEKWAFYGDTSLRIVRIGGEFPEIRQIGNSAFYSTSLQNLDLTRCNIEEDKVTLLNRLVSSVSNEGVEISPLTQGCVVTFSENDKWVLRDAANKTWEAAATPA